MTLSLKRWSRYPRWQSTRLRTEFVLSQGDASKEVQVNISHLSPCLLPPPHYHNPQIKSNKPLKFFHCHCLYFCEIIEEATSQRSCLPCWALLETGQQELWRHFLSWNHRMFPGRQSCRFSPFPEIFRVSIPALHDRETVGVTDNTRAFYTSDTSQSVLVGQTVRCHSCKMLITHTRQCVRHTVARQSTHKTLEFTSISSKFIDWSSDKTPNLTQ